MGYAYSAYNSRRYAGRGKDGPKENQEEIYGKEGCVIAHLYDL
jgi:hypothetical protein